MFIWEPGPTPPIPDPTLQKALQESAPPLELLKTTPTGYLRPSLVDLPRDFSPVFQGVTQELLCSVKSDLINSI